MNKIKNHASAWRSEADRILAESGKHPCIPLSNENPLSNLPVPIKIYQTQETSETYEKYERLTAEEGD